LRAELQLCKTNPRGRNTPAQQYIPEKSRVISRRSLSKDIDDSEKKNIVVDGI
jgi:hypothetical protein